MGAFIMASLDNGMSMMDVPTFWQYIVKVRFCCWQYGWTPQTKTPFFDFDKKFSQKPVNVLPVFEFFA